MINGWTLCKITKISGNDAHKIFTCTLYEDGETLKFDKYQLVDCYYDWVEVGSIIKIKLHEFVDPLGCSDINVIDMETAEGFEVYMYRKRMGV